MKGENANTPSFFSFAQSAIQKYNTSSTLNTQYSTPALPTTEH